MTIPTTAQIHCEAGEMTVVCLTAKTVVPPTAKRGSLMLVAVVVKVFAEISLTLFNAT
ncbi:MAG: hypothetical protein ABSD92_14205 [Candidatus Bathyarchaeia archaeon]|jgi:hypothetical protein